ncbi:hypothetical protein J5Y09_02180 [Roseomonas sp. PWR1]|uniref:Lipoprotein n=1 Tax=Roseomonas nitratireducens TaxID=2820810 RepID=A0ABS4AMX4_9PROT|nr:hypothetical protein [Neoroseomonas nitratireducens]MBP0462707.1 hypothetical protein [Neoroseomonas nitratireducens]
MSLPRRAVLPALLATAACGGGDAPPPPPSGPPSYSHLTPLRIAVERLEIVPPEPSAVRAMPPAPLPPAEVVRIMAQDRLSAAGGPGVARFRTVAATLVRESSSGGVFTGGSERLTCTLRCRLEIVSPEGQPAGFAEAEVRRTMSGPAGSEADRARRADEIVRQAGRDLNVEFEFQLRRNLRAVLAAPAAPAPAAAPVEAEPLPRS